LNKPIEISELVSEILPILSDDDAKKIYNKGWSFFNVYSLRELRDIYTINRLNPGLSVAKLYKLVDRQINFEEKEWSERRVLENLNALKNTKLIDFDGGVIKNAFINSELNSPLSSEDKDSFSELFFSYFRFKELSSWFISPEKSWHDRFNDLVKSDFIYKSKPLVYMANNNRFTDTFIYETDHPTRKYIIEDSMSHLMRFWDVYLKWGSTLNVIDKFNLSPLQIKSKDNKELSMAYFIRPFQEFDLLSFIQNKTLFNTRNIFLPQLVFELAKEFMYSIDAIKNRIVSEIKSNSQFTYERTSEIFIIKGKQSKKRIREATYLYPTINDSYISHLIIRK
jgi:hypothetical protein